MMRFDDHFSIANGPCGWIADMKAADVIATAAAFIALLSLFATIWLVITTRHHNRLSVRPFLDHWLMTSPAEPVLFTIVNAGIGPAIIRSCTYVFDGISYPISELKFPKAIEDEIKRLNFRCEYRAFQPGTALQAGDKLIPISFVEAAGDSPVHARLADFIERFGVFLQYESMYGERFPAQLGPKRSAPRNRHEMRVGVSTHA